MTFRLRGHKVLTGESLFFNSFTTIKQTTKFSSANFQKIISAKLKLCHIENSKTRGQTV